jgi:hypothetical protein
MNRILVSLLLTGVVNVCHAQFRPDCSCGFQDLYKLKIKSITDSTFNLQTGEKYKTSEMILMTMAARKKHCVLIGMAL